MRTLFIFFTILLYHPICLGQVHLSLFIEGSNEQENAIIKKFSYKSSHPNFKSLNTTIIEFEKKLIENGFLEFKEKQTQNGVEYTYRYQLGKQITTLNLSTKKLDLELSKKLNIPSNSIIVPFLETNSSINQILLKLEEHGLGTSSLKLANHNIKNDTLYSELIIDLAQKRTLDKIEITSTDKIPTQIIQTSLKKELHKTYSDLIVEKINSKIEHFDFLEQIKPPETLFTKDSTTVYLYVNKKNTNQFDGYVGFNNDENKKIKLNGYLDLKLNNILNHGEALAIMWKNNGNKHSEFSLNTEIPYIFKTPLAVKGSIEIQKQDSTYQNSSLEINLGYYFTYQSKIFLGHQTLNTSTYPEAVDLQNYTSKYITLTYEYTKNNKFTPLFPIQHHVFTKIGIGKKISEDTNNNHTYAEAILEKNFKITPKHFFYTKWNNFFLFSDTNYINEERRFGGIQTLRGFQENSLSGKTYSIINTEYRYILASNISVNTIIDYAYLEESNSRTKNHLYAFGLGAQILTNTGKLTMVAAIGKQPNKTIKTKDTTLHIGFSTLF